MYIHVMTMCMHLQAPEILLVDNSSPNLRWGVIFLSMAIFEDLLQCYKISDVCGAFLC